MYMLLFVCAREALRNFRKLDGPEPLVMTKFKTRHWRNDLIPLLLEAGSKPRFAGTSFKCTFFYFFKNICCQDYPPLQSG